MINDFALPVAVLALIVAALAWNEARNAGSIARNAHNNSVRAENKAGRAEEEAVKANDWRWAHKWPSDMLDWLVSRAATRAKTELAEASRPHPPTPVIIVGDERKKS